MMRAPRSVAAFLVGLGVVPALSSRPLPDVVPTSGVATAAQLDSLRARVAVVAEGMGDSVRASIALERGLAAQVRALEAAFAARDSVWASRTPRGSPVPGAVLTSGVSPLRFHPILRIYKAHRGVDLGAPEGTPVIATADGVVSYTFRNRSYGLGLDVDHGAGTFTRYAHLSVVLVRSGERVRRGTVLGRVGRTGLATGPHLHYETYIRFQRVDPVQTFGSGFRVAPSPGGAGDY
jgi:murein DD-endopeptidase MepM/ murein hydrolase activator NlpD